MARTNHFGIGARQFSGKDAPTKRHLNGEHAWFAKQPWDKLWHEFLTARQKNGKLAYLTAWAFVKEKTSNENHRRWMWRCIGPKPIALPFKEKKKTVFLNRHDLPYLGDWQQLRAKAFFYDNESVDKMRQVVAERLDGLEAGRGAAHIILDLIAKWMKYDDRIDEVFDASPVVAGLKPASNLKLSNMFFEMKNKTRHAVQELVVQYLQCHGISTDGLNDLGQLVTAVSQSGAKAALVGAAVGAQLPPSAALQSITQAMLDKAAIFKMPLPSALTNGHTVENHQDIEMQLNDEEEDG
jgi:hypothetical protein